jgi:hypothetical protein
MEVASDADAPNIAVIARNVASMFQVPFEILREDNLPS